MATIALPIRELSANVQYEAASAQKAFWEVVESKQQQAYFLNWTIRYMIHRLDRRMERLVVSQHELVDYLRKYPAESVPTAAYSKIAGDLDRLVSMTDSLVDDASQLPDRCTSIWRGKLEQITDLNDYIESFAESFRIASDQTCTALLAEIARKVAVEDAVTA